MRIQGIEGPYDRGVVRKVRAALKNSERVGVFDAGSSDPGGPLHDVYILGKTDKLLGSVRAPLARSLRLLILEAGR